MPMRKRQKRVARKRKRGWIFSLKSLVRMFRAMKMAIARIVISALIQPPEFMVCSICKVKRSW